METKRTIKAKDIVKDIGSGMTDSQLMNKHELSSKGLQSIFKKLINAKAMKVQKIFNRAPSCGDDTADVTNIRFIARDCVDVPLLSVTQRTQKIRAQLWTSRNKDSESAASELRRVGQKTLYSSRIASFPSVCSLLKLNADGSRTERTTDR
jgi:hypothetical protein